MGLYFCSLAGFAFIRHPLSFCGLLVFKVLCVVCTAYTLLGLSWYMALLCLVYVGGVYVLFIFVLVHKPNHTPPRGVEPMLVFVSWLVVACLLFIYGGSPRRGQIVDKRQYLCRMFEGFSYCLLCLVVLLGFTVVRLVVRRKDSFFR